MSKQKDLTGFSDNAAFQNIVSTAKIGEYTKRNTSSTVLRNMTRFAPVNEIGYSAVVFRGTRVVINDDKHDHIDAVYAMAYLSVSSDDKYVYICPKFVCTGPTYTSRDGEYRPRFVPFRQILEAKECYPDVWASAEDHLMKRVGSTHHEDELDENLCIPKLATGGTETDLKKGDLMLSAVVFPTPEHEQYADVISEWANDSRMAIHLFISAWLHDGFAINAGTPENHMNAAYKIMLYDIDDKLFFDKWCTRSDKWKLSTCMCYISYLQTDTKPPGATNVTMLGQKLIPLTIQEVVTVDVALGVWKELILGKLCSDLVLNGIAPGFPLYGGWFYLQGTDRRLYDNIAMYEKFEVGDEIIRVNDMLAEAKALVWRDGAAASADLDLLAKQINEAMRFSASYVSITDVSLSIITEYVGRTVRDLPTLVREKNRDPRMANWDIIHMFSRPGVFIKYIFDWLYNFNAMNKRLGALHGDVHLNNITVDKYIYMSKMKDGKEVYAVGPNPMAMYLLGGNAYLFEAYGRVGAVIDYSRSILADVTVIRRVDPDALNDIEYVQKRQRDLLFRLFHKVAPEIVDKNAERVKTLVLERFPLMHKIACAADPFMMADNIHLMLEAEFPASFRSLSTGRSLVRPWAPPVKTKLVAADQGALAPEIPKLLAKIRDMAREFLISHLLKAIAGDIGFANEVAFANEEIMLATFGDYMLKGSANADKWDGDTFKSDEYTVFDYFNVAGEMKFSSTHAPPQRPDEVQATITHEPSRELHQHAVEDYLNMIKQRPDVMAKVESMKARFAAVERLPVESTWRYEQR